MLGSILGSPHLGKLPYMGYSVNSLNGVYIGANIGDY